MNLDTYEFFNRFSDGYPVYNKKKLIIDKFEIVHFDGLHDFENVNLEVSYFLTKLSDQTIFIFDDIDAFDIEKISKRLEKNNFIQFQKKTRKVSYEYNK